MNLCKRVKTIPRGIVRCQWVDQKTSDVFKTSEVFELDEQRRKHQRNRRQ